MSRKDSIRMNESGESPAPEEKEGYSLAQNIYFGVVWVIVFAVMIWFIVGIAQQYKESNSSPATIITFNSVDQDTLPEVTICNWNQYDDLDNPENYTSITLESCFILANNAPCTLTPKTYLTYDRSGHFQGYIDCYQFNKDPNNVVTSNYTGYSGAYSAVFSVLNPMVNDPTLRIGLQVSFTEVGIDPDVYDEDKFAPPGFDSYYTIQAVKTQFYNETPMRSYTNFTSLYSTTGLVQRGTDEISYIGISWGFETLNEQNIAYTPQYTLNNFFGDFAGMIGTLMGLDVLKICAGFFVAYEAWQRKSFFHLQEHFNG